MKKLLFWLLTAGMIAFGIWLIVTMQGTPAA